MLNKSAVREEQKSSDGAVVSSFQNEICTDRAGLLCRFTGTRRHTTSYNLLVHSDRKRKVR